MQSGVCKFFNAGRGYGFVTPDDGSRDVFVHITHLRKNNVVAPLNEGEKVRYTAEPGRNGGPTITTIERVK